MEDIQSFKREWWSEDSELLRLNLIFYGSIISIILMLAIGLLFVNILKIVFVLSFAICLNLISKTFKYEVDHTYILTPSHLMFAAGDFVYFKIKLSSLNGARLKLNKNGGYYILVRGPFTRHKIHVKAPHIFEDMINEYKLKYVYEIKKGNPA